MRIEIDITPEEIIELNNIISLSNISQQIRVFLYQIIKQTEKTVEEVEIQQSLFEQVLGKIGVSQHDPEIDSDLFEK